MNSNIKRLLIVIIGSSIIIGILGSLLALYLQIVLKIEKKTILETIAIILIITFPIVWRMIYKYSKR